MPNMLEEIKDNLKNRMSVYTDSRQPSADEVRLAWLVSEIEELTQKRSIKKDVSINSYPSNYVEEDMPQIIVEIRYKKDYNPDNEVRKEEALALATKLKIFIDEIL